MASSNKMIGIFVFVVASGVVNALPWVDLCPPVPPMEDFDLQKGMWYEIMRLPFGQPLMTKCNTENYTVVSGSQVNISAQFVDLQFGNMLTSTGNATADATTPSVWDFWFPSVMAVGKLNVLSTDYENFAVLYSCTTYGVFKIELEWTLSRTPTLKPDILNTLLDNYKNQGGNPENLQYVDQSCSSS